MTQVSQRHLKQLSDYLIGEQPRSNGEIDMYCPLHRDSKRSASLNVLTGVWYCQAGCGGGSVIDLIRARSKWIPRNAGNNGHAAVHKPEVDEGEEARITEAMIKGWNAALLDDEIAMDYLIAERGIHTKTVSDFEIGVIPGRNIYTIPIRGPEREIWNVRYYNPHPRDDRRKVWSVKGMRATELYPYNQLESDRIIVCEGEWDVLATIQHGYPAITRTSAADAWRVEWNELFKDKIVYLANDCDNKGQLANRKIARALSRFADVRIVTLPYEIIPKQGKDLSDFWLEYDNGDFETLLANAARWEGKKATDPEIITVLDSFDAQRVGEPVKLQVTIKGKKEPGYSIPRKATLTCTRDAGAKCSYCPLNPAGGEAEVEIPPTSPTILSLLDASANTVFDALRDEYGAVKCTKLEIEVTEHQAVEQLFARPSIDHADGTKARDYKNIKITSVGRHDTLANNTVVVTGALHPSPRDQRNEFLAWSVEQQETSVDRFQVTPEAIKMMKMFQARRGQRPLKKLGDINRDLATHVTKIIGRPEMHALMDLTYHSVLSWKFGGQVVHRGWLEALVVGDTRTGKSEAAERLVRHFGAGEIVGGEAATLAGLVGGLQQIGGKDWAVTWGVIPINDRRIVVIDELSGLHPEEIAKMSDVRASGIARLTKIQQEVTFARTRLLWLGNPRNGGMDQYTYGVDAIKPLIGNPEDIARFDLAMAVNKKDVSAEVINKRIEASDLRYTSEACHTMLMWCWTRQPDQVVWSRGSEESIFKAAMALSEEYVEDPPLLQAANSRIKIARVAVALAARLFSTDDSFEKVVVTKEHVEDAVKFIKMLYEMPSFGYEERSRERLTDIAEAESNTDETREYLLTRRGLAKFMRSNSRFRRQDLEEIMNMDREGANAMINKLWEMRMVRKEGADIRVEPTLHEILRGARW